MAEPTYEIMSMDASDLAGPMQAWAAHHPGAFPPPSAPVETDWRWLHAQAAVMFNGEHWQASVSLRVALWPYPLPVGLWPAAWRRCAQRILRRLLSGTGIIWTDRWVAVDRALILLRATEWQPAGTQG